ncbi:hypothetical protein OF001_U40289 [Pseudomonas sp. OF001]|nr:hypothetical protein OF001_U40289 [Pseudomonas sp. OF001]
MPMPSWWSPAAPPSRSSRCRLPSNVPPRRMPAYRSTDGPSQHQARPQALRQPAPGAGPAAHHRRRVALAAPELPRRSRPAADAGSRARDPVQLAGALRGRRPRARPLRRQRRPAAGGPVARRQPRPGAGAQPGRRQRPARQPRAAARRQRRGAPGRCPAAPAGREHRALRSGVPRSAIPQGPARPRLRPAGGPRLAGGRRLDLHGKRERALDPRPAGQLAPAPREAHRPGALRPVAAPASDVGLTPAAKNRRFRHTANCRPHHTAAKPTSRTVS